MRNIESFSDQSKEKESYGSNLGFYLVFGLFVHLYSIPNIFFVYINDTWRLIAIALYVSYLIMSVGSAYVVSYHFSSYERLKTYLQGIPVCLWSLVTINLYGIQALIDHPFYQEVYINLLWIQIFLIVFTWIKWIPFRTRELAGKAVTIALGAFFFFHLLGAFNSTKGAGIYVFLFGEDAAVALIWPGWALFFSGFWTRVMMGSGIDLYITPEERARMIEEEKTREEASVRKVSEEMLLSGRFVELPDDIDESRIDRYE